MSDEHGATHTGLPEFMAGAWYEQCTKSVKQMQHFETGYTLFKPEYAEEILKRAERAREQYFYWMGQS